MSLTQAGIDALFDTPAPPPAASRKPRANSGSASGASPLPSVPAGRVARLVGLSIPISVVLADRELSVDAILEISVGTILEFDKKFDAELILNAAGQRIGAGYAVKVGENFGLRISRLDPIAQRVDALA